jgi:hypothetical protein
MSDFAIWTWIVAPALFTEILAPDRVHQGHFASGGRLERMELTLPPVFKPNVVPRS